MIAMTTSSSISVNACRHMNFLRPTVIHSTMLKEWERGTRSGGPLRHDRSRRSLRDLSAPSRRHARKAARE
jgi:hypothetical protein